MNVVESSLPIIPILILFIAAFITAFINDKYIKIKKFLAVSSTFLALIPLVGLVKLVFIEDKIVTYWLGSWGKSNGATIGIGMEVDALGLIVAIIVGIAVFLSSVYSLKYLKKDNGVGKYYILFLILSGSMLGFVLTGDIFNMYVMIEIMTFAAISLTAFRNNIYKSIEAGFKYIVTGSLGSALILLGTVLIYFNVQTLNLAEIAMKLPNVMGNLSTKLALASLLVGYGVKAFLVPCHTWPPDAHMSAPSSISMLLSGIMSKTGVYAIIRITYLMFGLTAHKGLANLLIVWGTITMVIGVSMALMQKDFKRLLAFHSVSQIGYIIVEIGIGAFSNGEMGLIGGLYHMINHATFKSLLFLVAGACLYKLGTTSLDELGGIGKKMPFTTVCFLVGSASISGIPPFNGFVSKWLIYEGTYKAGYSLVSIIALIVSVMTLASFIKVAATAFFGKESENVRGLDKKSDIPFTMKLPMAVLSIICLVLGMIPSVIIKNVLEPVAKAIMNSSRYITSMLGETMYLKDVKINFSYKSIGYYSPVSISIVLATIIVALILLSWKKTFKKNIQSEEYVFLGGEAIEYSNMKAGDIFYGFKHSLKPYFNKITELHSGSVNDYAFWVIVCYLILMLLCLFIV